jgi:hypothetical protein
MDCLSDDAHMVIKMMAWDLVWKTVKQLLQEPSAQ